MSGQDLWIVIQVRGEGNFEFQGIFSSREKAINASFENCVVYKITLDVSLPRETCEPLEHFFPYN